jgi:outer membrane protein
MNKFLFGAALAALTIPAAASAQRGGTPAAVIVVVDTNRLFSECNACRAAAPQLQLLISQFQQRQQQLSQQIQTEGQSIQTAGAAFQAMAPGAARTAAENSVRQRFQALQARQDAANQELQRLEQNIQSIRTNVSHQLNVGAAPIYQQVMIAHGANLAVDTEVTLARSNALDVTTEVLTGLNAAVPSVSVTPLPQQAPPPGQTQGR